MSSTLKITDLRLWVKLGYSAQEKAHAQPVSIDITLFLPDNFIKTAIKTDNLAHTVCYSAIIENLQKKIAQCQPFNLIESLTGCIYASVYQDLLRANQPDIMLEITLTKLSPPVPYLQGGTTFTYRGSLAQGAQDDLYQHWI